MQQFIWLEEMLDAILPQILCQSWSHWLWPERCPSNPTALSLEHTNSGRLCLLPMLARQRM